VRDFRNVSESAVILLSRDHGQIANGPSGALPLSPCMSRKSERHEADVGSVGAGALVDDQPPPALASITPPGDEELAAFDQLPRTTVTSLA